MIFEIANITAPIPLLVAWGILVGLIFSSVGAAALAYTFLENEVVVK